MSSRNQYSAGVHVGNWHEDAFGVQDASRQTLQRVPFMATSESKANFVAPQKMTAGDTRSASRVSMDAIPASQRDTPFHTLLGGGPKGAHEDDPANRFTTTSHAAHNSYDTKIQEYNDPHMPPHIAKRLPTTNRTDMSRNRAKEIVAGVDSRDPMRHKTAGYDSSTTVPFTSSYTTTQKLAERAVARQACKAKYLGHLPKAQLEAARNSPNHSRNTSFTRSFQTPMTGLRR